MQLQAVNEQKRRIGNALNERIKQTEKSTFPVQRNQTISMQSIQLRRVDTLGNIQAKKLGDSIPNVDSKNDTSLVNISFA